MAEIMSAEDLARKTWEEIDNFSKKLLGPGPFDVFKKAREIEPTKTMLGKEKEFAIKKIAVLISAQRQLGREEAKEELEDRYIRDLKDAGDAYDRRYTVVVEAARKAVEVIAERRPFCDGWGLKYEEEFDRIEPDLRKALADLDEAKGGVL